MGIDPAMVPCLDDAQSETRQMKGGYGDNEQKTFQRFRCRQFAGVDLVAARFLIEKAFLNVKAQAVLVQRPGISGLITHDEPGVIGLVEGAGQGQVDWPHGGA